MPEKKDYPRGAEKVVFRRQTTLTHRSTSNTPNPSARRPSGSSCTAGLRMSIPSLTSMLCASGSRRRSGEEYLIPLLGVWNRFDDIDFDKLPDKFMLKGQPRRGWNIAVQDKSKFDKADAKRKIENLAQAELLLPDGRVGCAVHPHQTANHR